MVQGHTRWTRHVKFTFHGFATRSTMSTTINLHCWVHGDDSGRIFSVEIAATKTVGVLEKAIKDKKQHGFGHVDDTLVLWKVSILFDANLE